LVYRPDASDRGLTLFGGANWTTSGDPDVERMIFTGAYYKGVFAPRRNDTLGFAVSLVDVNRRITERINSTLSKTTGGQASASDIDYEVYYGVALAPGVTLKPFFGFMSHPDQVDNPTPSGNLTHAVYLGVMFEVDVAHLLGLPTLNR
jgi:porin